MANNGSVNHPHLPLGSAGKFLVLVVQGCPLVSTKGHVPSRAALSKELSPATEDPSVFLPVAQLLWFSAKNQKAVNNTKLPLENP